MNARLAALFAAHKPVILGTAAAGVAGLALLQKRKAGSTSTSSVPVSGKAPTSGLTAATVQPTGSYDSSASDVYNTIQPQLEQLMRQQTSPIPVTAAPLAASLNGPNSTGRYVAYKGTGSGNNSINEVESDGSLYHLSMPEWQSIIGSNGGKEPTVTTFSGAAPTNFTGSGNLQTQINTAASKYGLTG